MTIHRAVRHAARAAIAILAATSLVAACSDDDDDEVGTAGQADASVETSVEVTDAWARTSPGVAEAGAVYLTITNAGEGDDALVDVAVDEAVAAKAELHETLEAEADGSTTMAGEMSSDTTGMGGGMGGMMQMQPVDEIAVPAGESVALEPGGYHVMLLALAEPLEEGGTVELVLTFAEAGDVPVTAEVRDTAP